MTFVYTLCMYRKLGGVVCTVAEVSQYSLTLCSVYQSKHVQLKQQIRGMARISMRPRRVVSAGRNTHGVTVRVTVLLKHVTVNNGSMLGVAR